MVSSTPDLKHWSRKLPVAGSEEGFQGLRRAVFRDSQLQTHLCGSVKHGKQTRSWPIGNIGPSATWHSKRHCKRHVNLWRSRSLHSSRVIKYIYIQKAEHEQSQLKLHPSLSSREFGISWYAIKLSACIQVFQRKEKERRTLLCLSCGTVPSS